MYNRSFLYKEKTVEEIENNKPKYKTLDEKYPANANANDKKLPWQIYGVNTNGAVYSNILIFPGEENKERWEWIFEKWKLEKDKDKDSVKNKFKDISSGFSDTNPKSLNKVCETAYKEPSSNINSEDFYEIFKYCIGD